MALTKRTAGLPLICLVCGDVARGINFDLMTCMSCKAFFRRHAAKTSSQNLRCALNEKCEINQRTRGACSACRLKKCLGLGMNSLLIRNPLSAKSVKVPSSRSKNEQIVVRSPQPLSLLQNDRSTMTTDDWTLLSNMIHAYDAVDIFPQAKALLEQQISLPAKLRLKPSTALFIMKSFYSSIQRLLDRSPYFHNLSAAARRTLIEHNTEIFGAFTAIFILREIDALGYGAFSEGCSSLYGSEAVGDAGRFLGRLDSNNTLVKVMLFISAFATNCSIVKITPYEHLEVVSNALILIHVQDTLVTMFWKYLLYQYGFRGAILCFNALIKYLLDLMRSAALRATSEHNQMIENIIEETTCLFVTSEKVR